MQCTYYTFQFNLIFIELLHDMPSTVTETVNTNKISHDSWSQEMYRVVCILKNNYKVLQGTTT